jgi:hypothetical protein
LDEQREEEVADRKEALVLDERLAEGQREVVDAALLDCKAGGEFDKFSLVRCIVNSSDGGHLLVVGAELPTERRLDLVPGPLGILDP